MAKSFSNIVRRYTATNLAPTYVRRYTATKYYGHDVNDLKKYVGISSSSTSVPKMVYSDLGVSSPNNLAIASSFGKFLFFEKEESTALSSSRLCISTKSHQLISETVQRQLKEYEVDHVSESNDEQPIDDFEILQTKLNNMDEQAFDNELGTEGDKKDGENRYSIDSPKKKMEEDTNFNSTNSETKDNSSDLSRPPGFEFMKKSFSSSSNCSTSFARRRKNDIKGFSLLSELNQIIDVGSSLGYDVRGCKKTLNKMIKGIGIHMVDK
ncbi:hypothetical protein Tco_0551152 [Tanacetum coccineum]